MPGRLTATAIGHLGGDPDSKFLQDGKQVTTFSVGCNVGTKAKPATEWVRVSTWGKLAEICSQYLSSGRLVFAEGRLTTRSYETSSGEKRFVLELNASDVQILDKQGERTTPGGSVGNPDDLPEETDDPDQIPF